MSSSGTNGIVPELLQKNATCALLQEQRRCRDTSPSIGLVPLIRITLKLINHALPTWPPPLIRPGFTGPNRFRGSKL